MLSSETLESAHTWYQTGVQRIHGGSPGTGVAYLERAIPVFAEADALEQLTLARHYLLLAYKLEERFEELESLFPEVMQGYAEQQDAYGQSLLLCHLAEAQAAQGRWQRAHSLYNLACVVAENDQLRELVTYVLHQQGQLCRERDDYTHALRCFERAEKLISKDDTPDELAQFRYLRAQALSQLGETSEAIALLEDVQTHHVRAQQNYAAMDALNLLRSLYEDQGLVEDRNRIAKLMNLSGQRMLQRDMVRKPIEHLGPPVDRQL